MILAMVFQSLLDNSLNSSPLEMQGMTVLPPIEHRRQPPSKPQLALTVRYTATAPSPNLSDADDQGLGTGSLFPSRDLGESTAGANEWVSSLSGLEELISWPSWTQSSAPLMQFRWPARRPWLGDGVRGLHGPAGP